MTYFNWFNTGMLSEGMEGPQRDPNQSNTFKQMCQAIEDYAETRARRDDEEGWAARSTGPEIRPNMSFADCIKVIRYLWSPLTIEQRQYFIHLVERFLQELQQFPVSPAAQQAAGLTQNHKAERVRWVLAHLRARMELGG